MLHDKYKGRCVIGGFRVLPYNRFRDSVHHFFPTLKLEKTKTDMCNECFRIKIKLSDPDISEEEKLGLKKKLSVHLGESNIQRRAMNAYRQELSPSDPVPHRPPCSVEEINYKVLLEAMNLHKSNPVLDCDLDDLETIYMDDDQMESDAMDIEEENVHVKLINSILSPSRIDAENNDVLDESNTLDVSVVEETTVSSDFDGAESQSFNLDGDWRV